MLASFGVDDTEQIHAEEEFISPINRFNAMALRVPASLIALLSRWLAGQLAPPPPPRAPRDRRVAAAQVLRGQIP